MQALLLVDIQNDFMPFGALPVARGDEVVPLANRLTSPFELVVATQDWHPFDHGSFASNHPGTSPGDTIELGGVPQVLWPDHCVQNRPGASFHSALDVSEVDAVFRKGTDSDIDSYSAFFDNGHLKATGLGPFLKERSVEEVVMVGLATDYCVLYSARDARSLGFEVTVVVDGVRGVELSKGDSERAFEEMRSLGCRLVTSGDV